VVLSQLYSAAGCRESELLISGVYDPITKRYGKGLHVIDIMFCAKGTVIDSVLSRPYVKLSIQNAKNANNQNAVHYVFIGDSTHEEYNPYLLFKIYMQRCKKLCLTTDTSRATKLAFASVNPIFVFEDGHTIPKSISMQMLLMLCDNLFICQQILNY
jgi:hypothetical protein